VTLQDSFKSSFPRSCSMLLLADRLNDPPLMTKTPASLYSLCVQSTRGRIVGILLAGGATVDGITNELGLAPATVRRHLDVLLRDGLVEMRSERLRLGRPHFVFTLSEEGLEGLPRSQFRFVAAVLETVLDLRPRDTRGRSGSQIAELVFDRLAHQLLKECTPAITGTSVAERLRQAVEALRAAGLDLDVSVQEDGYAVTGTGCPCSRLLSGSAECPHEARLLSGLVGAPLERREGPAPLVSRSFLLRGGA
jgi:predicted ArsR family transcriptional regulator